MILVQLARLCCFAAYSCLFLFQQSKNDHSELNYFDKEVYRAIQEVRNEDLAVVALYILCIVLWGWGLKIAWAME